MINLFSILLENIDCNQLIEEGKDPVEVLHYKFQNIPSDIIDDIIDIDPTKKKSYSQWVLSKWNDESEIITSSLQNGRLEKLFKFFKEHQEKQIKDCPSVREGIDAYVPKDEDTVLDKSSKLETYVLMLGGYVDSDLANDFDIVFNQDNWLIAVPNTYEASCKLGENCWWCTANHYGNGRGYYNQYLGKGGKYYINFDLSKGETLYDKTEKEYPYTRYQFHFESNQFKAASEGEPDVCLEDLNIPQSAIDFYYSIDSDYVIGGKSEEERMEEYLYLRDEDRIFISDNLYLNVEFNDDYEYEEPDLDNTSWYVFDTEDGRDPISWTAVDPHIEESIEFKIEDSLYVIRQKYNNDAYLVLSSHDGNSRWREWGGYEIDAFLPLENGVFTIINSTNTWTSKKSSSSFTIFRSDRSMECLLFDVPKLSEMIKKMWINDKVIGNNAVNIEITYYNTKFHSLIQVSEDDIDWLIKRDIPVNGNYYEVEENNIIHGNFRDYSVNVAYETYDDENYYHLLEKIDENFYLVEKNIKTNDKYGDKIYKTVLNIFNKSKNSLVLNFWADNIEVINEGYIVSTEGKKGLYDTEGKVFFEGEYSNIIRLVQGNSIYACISINYTDLVDAKTKENFLRVKQINTNISPINNKIIVQTFDSLQSNKVYDYVKKEFAYKDSLDETPIFSYGSSIVRCLYDSNGNNIKYSLKDYGVDNGLEIPIDAIYMQSGINARRIIKDNKVNLIAPKGLLLPVWCDEIISASDAADFVTFKNNDKYFYYDLSSKSFQINPNGFDYYPYDDRGGNFGGIAFKTFLNNDLQSVIQVNYYPKNNEFYAYKIDNVSGLIGEWKKPEYEAIVMSFINELTSGRKETQQENVQYKVPAMSEQFKNMLKRINEARKLNYIDKLK